MQISSHVLHLPSNNRMDDDVKVQGQLQVHTIFKLNEEVTKRKKN